MLSKLGPIDTLVVTKLDRLVRNTKESFTIIEGFAELLPDFSNIKDLPYHENAGDLFSGNFHTYNICMTNKYNNNCVATV
ncbi:hypothetical protein BGP34_04110 [Bacillus mycoides]|nr:hypothetical protein BGP34_04110 [Bacillus mycoides]